MHRKAALWKIWGFFTLTPLLMGITGVVWGKTTTLMKKSLATYEGFTVLKKVNLCQVRKCCSLPSPLQ